MSNLQSRTGEPMLSVDTRVTVTVESSIASMNRLGNHCTRLHEQRVERIVAIRERQRAERLAEQRILREIEDAGVIHAWV